MERTVTNYALVDIEEKKKVSSDTQKENERIGSSVYAIDGLQWRRNNVGRCSTSGTERLDWRDK